MGGLPDALFVIDTNKEELAVREAAKLGIPVIAILDSNSNPDGVTFPVAGNDDSTKAIQLYLELVSGAVLDGIQQEMIRSGADLGALADPVSVDLDDEAVEEEATEETAGEAQA